MKIAIDARMYGLENAGIGRYVMNLVDRLVENKSHQWLLFIAPKHIPHFDKYAHVKTIPCTIRHYSLAEQTKFLRLLNRTSFDLIHFPHFNVPLLYNKPFVVTIHDILWHQVKGGNVTTLSPLMYHLKYSGYKATVNHALTKAKAIMVPSNYVKNDIIEHFKKLDQQKITVTYEGVDTHLITQNESNHIQTVAEPPYLMYIGSAYPHKNLTILLKAMKHLSPNVRLKIIGSRSIFLDQIKQHIKKDQLESRVECLGYQTDEEVKQLLESALALVHPSKSEGFGLTGLEAMASSCPVISSNATALPEIYQDACLYFDPDNETELVTQIEKLQGDPNLRSQLIAAGLKQVGQFSWDKTVKQTELLYQKAIGE